MVRVLRSVSTLIHSRLQKSSTTTAPR